MGLFRGLIPDVGAMRAAWVRAQLARLPKGSKLLDAGCGTQPFREDCRRLGLAYKAQDFGAYDGSGDGVGLHDGDIWHYGKLDYTGDVWDIAAKSASFDAILCTEVLEHIPYPIDAIKEFGRLLKKGGTLILTVPVNCLPHQTPYFFYHGIARQLYEKVGTEAGLKLTTFKTYPSVAQFLATETLRDAMARPLWLRAVLGAYLIPYALFAKYTQPKQWGETYPASGALMVFKKR